MHEFIKKHQSRVIGTLSGFDRHVRLTEFGSFAESLTARLKAAVEQVAQAARQSIQYLASSQLSKEDLVQELLAREGLKEGIVCRGHRVSAP